MPQYKIGDQFKAKETRQDPFGIMWEKNRLYEIYRADHNKISEEILYDIRDVETQKKAGPHFPLQEYEFELWFEQLT